MSKLSPPQCGDSAGSSSDKDIREEMPEDMENKLKACSNPTYECKLPRIEGYDFCMQHILINPRGNFRRCSYIYRSNKKCSNAVPKHDRKKDPNLTTLCFEHNRQVQLQKTHSTVGKWKHAETNEALLNSLAHHLNVGGVTAKNDANCDQDEEIDVVSPDVTPFVPIDQVHNSFDIVNTVRQRKRILDYASDSSTDEGVICVNNTAKGYEGNESDNESVDSQDDDLLKHAGTYTCQEAIRISEAKLTKLQGLYIDQINRLHVILREKRRRYLHAIRREREHLCSIHDQIKENPKERALYEKLKAMNSYHRRHGVEAVLYKKLKEKRSRTSDSGVTTSTKSSYDKCIFTEGGVKCGDRVLPCSKYCHKHILEDKRQVLFKACGREKSDVVCQEPIPCIFDDSPCVLHLTMPQQRQYVHKKYETETGEG